MVPGRKVSGAPPVKAEIGMDYCDKHFRIEEQLKSFTPEERFCKRLELEELILDAFFIIWMLIRKKKAKEMFEAFMRVKQY